MNVIEAALTSFTEYEAAVPELEAEEFAASREEFLGFARQCAKKTLSQAAADLDWQYTPADELAESVEQATALLEPGRPEYLRYLVDHGAETTSFDLVRPCTACGHSRIDSVDGYITLGRLLSQGSSGRS